ncbi:GAT domain-containing protein [Colletotrichum tamarilloi]|uniref:GAT domain-containing protein n=1 Tax=Colletotrichum tamarilloi TaxID=1209934 RepID=A0ABQ9RC57_9PEZI|nr:GAT domain-containing protein [Colletotrichum tamarilloi]KAK1500793.1 GAT domain-containing protein [Colletotrichum tamarilloi]
MKAMKGLSVNRMMSTLKKRTTNNFSGSSQVSASPVDPQNETPEATAARSVKQFCESGGPNAQGDEVLYLPPIVDAAESSPAAAAECARIIRKYLAKDNHAKASWQYNAIMLIRILTDNPGPTFTRNMDKKFADTVKELYRTTHDPSVRQMLSETLDTFEATKFDDQGLGELISMWKKEKERSYKQYGNPRQSMAGPDPRTMNAPPFNPHSQNYFARNHTNRSLPTPVELASRLEEARTSAKLLSQVVVNTPPQEVINNDLIKEFADRCQSASRSIQLYMTAENPSPDNETMEHLIDTNEQLQSALNQHQRAVLGARKQLGIDPRSDNASPVSPQTAESQQASRTQEWAQAQAQSSSSSSTPPLPTRPSEGSGKGKASETFAPPPGPPPKAQPQYGAEDPFRDPQPEIHYSSSSRPGGSGGAVELPGEEPRLAHEPFHPGFNPTPSYLGRQDSALGKITMHGADEATTPGPLSGNPIQTVDLRNRQETLHEDSDDDLYESTPKSSKKKDPVYRPGELEKVQGLWKFQVQRVKAQTWAYRDIKFLVYDDTADADESDSKTGKTSENTAIFERPPKFMPTSSDHDSSVALQTLGDGDEDPMFKQATISSLKQPHSEAGPAAAFEHPPEDDDMDDPDLQEAIRMSLMSDDESSDGPITADPSSLTPEDENMDDPELQEAIRLSLMSDGESGNAPISAESGPSVTNTDEDEDVFECRICSKLPTFPHDKKTWNFRLFKPADEFPHLVTERPSSVDVCVHYIAVSYCWPEEIKDEYGNTVPPIIESKVRDLNDRPHTARALDDVLDRAVDFAISVGLRMIWIDQECLPQPKEDGSEKDKAYQRLGVQALDIVYNRAIVTAGLHESTISKTEMSAVQFLIEHETEELRYLSLRPQLFQYALDFLYMVQADKWYTRAWVIQEAVSASDGLVLVFRRGLGVVYTSKLRADQKKYSTPRHPLDSERRTLKSEIICIPVGLFRVLVETCKSLLEQRFQFMGQALIRTNTGKNAIPILSVTESLHPKITVRQHVAGIHVYGGKVYGGRQKVNAATALTLLKSRHCRDVQDRLTILANMCSYEIRLDPIRVAKECDSLRLGILATTLLNGDTSLLVPEVYDFPGDEDGEPDPSMDRCVGSLLSPFDTDSKGISSYAVQDGKLVNPAVYKHSFGGKRKGLHLCAYLWTVDDTLDLSPLKYQFAEIWHRMKCLRIIMDRQKEESVDEFARRKGLITQHFSKNHVRDRAKSEIFHHGVIAADSSVWEGPDAREVQVKAYLDAYRVEAEPEMQKIVAEIFFAILRYLHDLREQHMAIDLHGCRLYT